VRVTYSRWDGRQAGPDLDAAGLFDQIADDVLYHGDLDAALRRLFHDGLDTSDGEHLAGLREILRRIQERRQQLQESGDPNTIYPDIMRRLDEIIDEEREAIDRYENDAGRSGDEKRERLASGTAAERRLELDLLPSDLPGRIESLRGYDFISPHASTAFHELIDELTEQVAAQAFGELSRSISSMDASAIDHLRRAMDALNTMIEQRERGDELDPSFDAFMEEFGDLFPGNPSDLDELLSQLAGRMAALSQVLAAMSPEQRAELERLMSDLLGDLDLAWQVDRLASNLARALPDMGWGQAAPMRGSASMGLAEAIEAARDLGSLDELERLLRSPSSPAALAEADMDEVARLLGKDISDAMRRLAGLARQLEEAGLIERREGRHRLTARGMRRIGESSLAAIFRRMQADRLGGHEDPDPGLSHDREGGTRPYRYGDRFDIDIRQTVHNAVLRSGGGVPVSLHPEDFEVALTEQRTRAATVIMIDLSLSMPMRDNFLAAKKVAIAMHTLISTRYRGDFIGMVGFSEVAREISIRELPQVSWDFVYGTNMQHGIALARRMLAHQQGTRQILMITDGEPTAHILDDGEVFFNYPPVRATIDATMAEVVRATREHIVINTFVLDPSPPLRSFAERMARTNHGRVLYTTPDTLGQYVLVDFLERRSRIAGLRRGRAV